MKSFVRKRSITLTERKHKAALTRTLEQLRTTSVPLPQLPPLPSISINAMARNNNNNNSDGINTLLTCAECCCGGRIINDCCAVAAATAVTTPACCTGGNQSLPMSMPPPPTPPQQPPLQVAATCCATNYMNAYTATRPPPLAPIVNKVTNSASRTVIAEEEEQFVSIDDVKVRKFLEHIALKHKQLKRQENRKTIQNANIIDLTDDNQEEEAPQPIVNKSITKELTTVYKIIQMPKNAKRQPSNDRKSPDICLIPKLDKENSREEPKIVASIDLIDDSSDSNDSEPMEPENLTVDCVLLNTEDEQMHVDAQNANMDDDESDIIDVDVYMPVFDCSDDDEQNETNANNMIFHCNICSKVMQSSSSMQRHLIKHTDVLDNTRTINAYGCVICGKAVQSNYNLRRHMMIHTGERPFGCDLCVRRFREFSDLKKHRKRHMRENRYLCMICQKGTPTEHDSIRCAKCESKNLMIKPDVMPLAAHELAETKVKPGKLFRIELKTTTQPPVTTATLTPAPTPTPTPTFTSTPTPLSITAQLKQTLPKLKSNLNVSKPTKNRAHKKSFGCVICKRSFGTRHNLKRHLMIHTGEKPFSCTTCRKPFREQSTLKKHMVTHDRDRRYKCPHCPRKYKDYLNYMKHKLLHKDLNANNDISDKAALHPNMSNDSIEDDEYEDGYSSPEHYIECCECEKRFTEIDAYTEHVKQHKE